MRYLIPLLLLTSPALADCPDGLYHEPQRPPAPPLPITNASLSVADALDRLHDEFANVRFGAWNVCKEVDHTFERPWSHRIEPCDVSVRFVKACLYEPVTVEDTMCLTLWYRVSPPKGEAFPGIFQITAEPPQGWTLNDVRVWPEWEAKGQITCIMGDGGCNSTFKGAGFGFSGLKYDESGEGADKKYENPRLELEPFEVTTEDGTFLVGFLMRPCDWTYLTHETGDASQ